MNGTFQPIIDAYVWEKKAKKIRMETKGEKQQYNN